MNKKSCCSDELKKKFITHLNRIEGQVRGIKAMIERDDYCDDILNQIAAVQSSMSSVGKNVLENHMRTCIVMRLGKNDQTVVDEFVKTVSRLK